MPDIGDFKDIPVIESAGEGRRHGQGEDPLVTLESDKATMDVPAPLGGVVKEIKVKVGDSVSEGGIILSLATGGCAGSCGSRARRGRAERRAPAPAASRRRATLPAGAASMKPAFAARHASPSVRKFARELGVDLVKVRARGERAASCSDDVAAFVKARRGSLGTGRSGSAGRCGGGASTCCRGRRSISPSSVRSNPSRSRASRRSRRANLHRNWVMIPHVTNHDEADITELEASACS